MYRQGHYARVKKPTGPELYEDASRILEELLQKQLNDQLKAHGHPHRYKTHPLDARRPVTSGEVLDEREEFGLDDGIERCKTMPSRMPGTAKGEPTDLCDRGTLPKKAERWPRLPDSSPDTDAEGDSSLVSEHRRKKSLLQKAKDRFRHAFHRQERQKEIKEKLKDSPQNSPTKQRRKMTGKEEATDRNGFRDSQEPEDKRRGTMDSKGSSQCSQSEVNSRRKNSGGKALLSSIKKSFRTKKDDKRNFLRDGSDRSRPPEEEFSGSSKSRTPSAEQEELSARRPSLPSDKGHPPPPLARPGGFLTVVQMAKGKDSSASPHEKSPSPFPHSTSTDSHYDTGNKSSSLYSFSSTHQSNPPHTKNVLDDPGDDIEFMDDAENGEYNDEGIPDGAGAGPRTVRVPVARGERGGGSGRSGEDGLGGVVSRIRTHRSLKHQSSLCADGDIDNDTQDGNGHDLGAKGDLPLHERTKEEKEEMYGMIAQKLIQMADTYAAESGLSDAEAHQRDAGGQPTADGDGLSELEKQITECLRNLGDRNSQLIEGPAEEMLQQTKEETYERFQKTVQHALGEEVSWNHLAILFYTTKGVVSAVGKGSKLASAAKEMTLHYFSDKCAKWIMDQGGFDSVLSESDSELD